MEENRVSTPVKVLTVGSYLLAGILILVCCVLHLNSIQAGLSTSADLAIEQLTFIGGIIAAVILVIDTAVLGTLHILKKFPSTLSVGTMVYNDVALIASVFLMHIYDNRGAVFPYSVAYAIPAITFVLSAICLIDDCVKAKAPAEDGDEEMEFEELAEEELATETVFEPDYVGTTDNMVEDAAEEEGPSEKELRKLEKQKAKEEKKQAKLLAKQQKQAEKQAAAEAKAAEKAAAAEAKALAAEQKEADKVAAAEAKAEAETAAEEARLQAVEQKAAEKAAAEAAKAKLAAERAAAVETAKAKAAAPSFENTKVEFKSISFDDFGDYMEDDD